MADPARARLYETNLPPVVVHLVYSVGRYTTAECQLGAHHACPGGTRKGLDSGGGIVPLLCQCSAAACACGPRRSAVEEPPRLDPQGAGQG